MKKAIYTKGGSLAVVAAVYALAFVAAIPVFILFEKTGVLWATFAADVTATLVVWGFGLVFKNASLYDPYWSIVPVMVIPFWMMLRGAAISAADILLLTAVFIWGVRLTANWVIGWGGMDHQDWRYTMLKEKNPDKWFITNLGGINMMPTILVFLAMVPAYHFIRAEAKVNGLVVLGFLICLGSAMLQFFADKQMYEFRSEDKNKDRCIDCGLWKYSRHPNYLGEVGMWWGIWVMQMGAVPETWYTVAGPVFMTALFVFISIPMMESHVKQNRLGYVEYEKQVPMLLPGIRNLKKHKKQANL